MGTASHYFDRLGFVRWLRGFFGAGRRSRASASSGGSSILSTSASGPGLDLGCGTDEILAEPEVTAEMIEAAYWTLHGFSPEAGGIEETLTRIYREMAGAKATCPRGN